MFHDSPLGSKLEWHNLKELAEDLRDVLFPIRSKVFRPYKDRNIMYDRRIKATNKVINHLGKEGLVKQRGSTSTLRGVYCLLQRLLGKEHAMRSL
jgi:hypothetical protein